ncbi:MAG TPA: PAS domain-containing sensor histidine kinase [Xanthobacteraceae bacterium]|jgi:two-component system nitrogen regulation sensor histidine kinase NtrY|nr:PAS domain-containing sensor histidine kinase [Xanthobacteraceae bacterium]
MSTVEQTATANAAIAGTTSVASFGSKVLGLFAVGLALLSALATFLILSDLTPIAPTHVVVLTCLLTSAAAVLLLVTIIGREIWLLVQARRRGRAGSRIHVRIVTLFSLIAAAPAILVAIVASVTLDRGLDRMFSARTRSMLENSLALAETYLREQGGLLRGEMMAMSIDVARAKPLYDQDQTRFAQFMNNQATVRGLPFAEIVGGDSKIIASAKTNVNMNVLPIPKETFPQVTETNPKVGVFLDGNYVAGVIKLRGFDNAYLYTARPFAPNVVPQLRETEANVAEFNLLQSRRFGIQLAFALLYTVIALIVLLSAVWIGLNFANYLVAPIRRLIGAANLVSTGNLYVQVPTRRSEGDLAHLGETFNKMTQELRTQRDDIMRARDLIDSRRIFTEAVLAGASAGVIGIDASDHISILNRSAEKLIGTTEIEGMGQPLSVVLPEIDEMMEEAHKGQRLVQGQVTVARHNRERTLSVRVTTEQSSAASHGYVITLDDITDLVSAQRTAAWADVARRIAHEIKNPLTPIQLSAERLKRKYRNTITEDKAVFEQCTDTIIRQVDDIKRMVDEFSRFARTPKPVMAADDVAETVRQAVFLMRVGHPDITFDLDIAEDPMPAQFDRRLLSQSLTNIIKNAAESVGAVPPDQLDKGSIKLSVAREGPDIVIDIVDNGIGLPTENRNRLLEPYVTTREKGTGLGLAIVGRILEEHGGGISLNDAADRIPGQRGAWVRMRFASEQITTVDAPASAKATMGEV